MAARIRVALLFGGRSTEHEISCISAGSVLRAIDRKRYEIIPIGITREGRWVRVDDDPSGLEPHGRALPSVPGDGPHVALPADPTAGGLRSLDPSAAAAALGPVDVVFPLLHGTFGEDGAVQGLLELAGVPYVGCGVFGSAAAMDKVHMKVLLQAAALLVGPYVVVRSADELTDGDRRRLGLPVFVKPARSGSSVGISKVKKWGDFDSAVADARRHDPKVVVEAAVEGREVECAVLDRLGGGPPEASVPAEILVPEQFDFYDYEAKYLSEDIRFAVPADLPAGTTAAVREVACRAFTALDCAGLARVDVFVRPDGSVLLNEVNTMPGFTPVSMFPRMWAATGVDYPQLIDRLLRLALARGAGLH
jgi:D-alanine-D-alanine ligase